MQRRKLEELNLLDDFLFGSMVTHPEVGEYPEGEKHLRNEKEPDIRAKCSNIYDIEPDQKDGKSKTAVLPKRVRFYHGIIDAQLLRSGAEYDSLKNVTIIMIVPFDPFGYDRTVYTITRSCREVPGMPYDDGSRTLYLYTQGKEGNVSEELRQLLNYMEKTTRENAVNKELQEIQQMVEQVKTDEGGG